VPNRLAGETSPYLQQHAANPVDWFPWGPEALERARREDKPILLSVGYSACHWCHVMAHESFEDAAVAAVMNRYFVNVKVDREERPDLDHIYQSAHQMLAQRPGGWPLTMFLTPDGAPFFGGTYFPKHSRYGLPGFADLCERIAAIWRDKRSEIEAQNAEVLKAFERTLPRREPPGQFSGEVIRAMLDNLRSNFDAQLGGFGTAPKFPHPADLELCLREGERDMALVTLERMCEGGIYDHLGGGFCRYSTDAQWMIPHFEKMLYDNGPLLALLADAWVVSGSETFKRCAEETATWLIREMQSPEGGYYSSLDADSEHEEGKFYVWDREEVKRLLSADEYAAVAARFGLDREPNFEGKHWHLHAYAPLDAGKVALVDRARFKLLTAREMRVHPGRDEKVLVSWNALAIRGMAHAARVFRRPEWLLSARRALDFIHARMWRDRLLATYKDGRAHLNAYLDDYAFLVAALLEVMQAEFSPADLDWAKALAEVLLSEFEDESEGGFFFTGAGHERLFHRPKPGQDHAMPSGNAMAAWSLGRLAYMTGEQRYSEAAERTLRLFYPLMRDHPAGYAAMAMALSENIAPPKLLVLRGRGEELARWRDDLAREYLPEAQVLVLPHGMGGLPAALAKPEGPGPVNGWLCRGVICLPPISDFVQLKAACKEKT
jgi:uncharacterized protein YyaL (SSP411 family)